MREPSAIRYTFGSAGLWGSVQFLRSLHQSAATPASVDVVMQQAKLEGLKGGRVGALAGLGVSYIARKAYRMGERRGQVLVAEERLPLSGGSAVYGIVCSAVTGFGLGSSVACLPGIGKDLIQRSVNFSAPSESMQKLFVRHIKVPHLKAGLIGASVAAVAFQNYLAGINK